MSIDWHTRFEQQAGWTRHLRAYLFRRAGIEQARRVLEVGCGTGAVLAEVPGPAARFGLDLEPARLSEARLHAPAARLVCADAHALPFPDAAFDLTFCHFLLLWLRDPLRALGEMKRVTRPGGFILALAEPDYSRRLDRPAELEPLGRWQTESLRRQGADPSLGGRLADLFQRAGIRLLETGSLRQGGERPLSAREREIEWAVLEADLAGLLPQAEIQRLKQLDAQAWQAGKRILYVPTHFAWGKRP
ncbi:MAG: methyltransferase domain-containing protein [Anaerolineales bacterium]